MNTFDAHPLHFANDDIIAIVKALPSSVDHTKLTHLPRILHEWSRTDLPEHLARKFNRLTRAQRKNLDLIHEHASELAAGLQSLEVRNQRLLAAMIAADKVHKQVLEVSHTEYREAVSQLQNMPESLLKLADGANAAIASTKQGRGKPRELAPYLIMMDLAAIYEYLTGMPATRSVRGEDHSEYGAEYRPFWDFAKKIWPAIFGSTGGLKSAIRNWARARNKYGESSALIANMNSRHPEWGLFDE